MELGGAETELEAADAEHTAAVADIGEHCGIQEVGAGPDWQLHIGVVVNIEAVNRTAARIIVEHGWAGHVADIGGRPFQKKVAGVGIAVASAERTGMTVGISGCADFEGVVDFIGAAICCSSRLPSAAAPGSIGCIIAHGDFSVDIS